MATASLRQRQSALAREAIFEALVRHLEAGDADDVPMEDLARDAGVSRRTLYRYFPTRDELISAASDWIRSEVLQLPIDIGNEGITGSFRDAAARLGARPKLARALLRSATGRALRTGYRSARVEAIRRALRRDVPGLPTRTLDDAAAVLSYLCSSSAWISLQDEAGLDARRAQGAVEWAIESLLARLRDDKPAISKGGRR